MKTKFEGINSDNLLKDILNKSEKMITNYKEKQTDFLGDLKVHTFNTFAENMIKLDRQDILKEFDKRLKKYNTDAMVYIDKKNKET